MTPIEMYQNGLISLEELIYKLYDIDPDGLYHKAWIKDALFGILNDINYSQALTIINAL